MTHNDDLKLAWMQTYPESEVKEMLKDKNLKEKHDVLSMCTESTRKSLTETLMNQSEEVSLKNFATLPVKKDAANKIESSQ